jgi:hypothetical protein
MTITLSKANVETVRGARSRREAVRVRAPAVSAPATVSTTVYGAPAAAPDLPRICALGHEERDLLCPLRPV